MIAELGEVRTQAQLVADQEALAAQPEQMRKCDACTADIHVNAFNKRNRLQTQPEQVQQRDAYAAEGYVDASTPNSTRRADDTGARTEMLATQKCTNLPCHATQVRHCLCIVPALQPRSA